MIQRLITPFLIVLVLGYAVIADDHSEVESFSINGLKVLLKKNTANNIISAQLYLRGGCLNLNESTQGIEPLLFNSAFKGSKKYPKDELNRILDRTAAQLNTVSGKDYTSVNLRCIRRYFNETWDVFADVVTHPLFDPREVELVREQLLSGIRQREDNPDAYLREIANDLFYADHPYQFNAQGTEQSMSNISIDQLNAYLSDKLVKSRLLLVVVGNVDKEELARKISSTLGNLPKGNYQPVFPQTKLHERANIRIVERELPTNYIIGYFSAPGPNDPDFYPLSIAMNILRTRVFEEVRTKRNLSYAPSAFVSNTFANQGAIYVTAVDPDTTIKVMMSELRKLQTEQVTQKDLRDRVTMYLTRYYLNNETNAAQGQFLARFELSGQGYSASRLFVENLRKVTADDVQKIANKYFHNLQFAILGNPQLVNQQLFTSM